MQRAAPVGRGDNVEVTPEELPLAPHLARDPHGPDGLLHRLSHGDVVEPGIDRRGRRAISVPQTLADDRQARSPNGLPATKGAPQIVQSQGAARPDKRAPQPWQPQQPGAPQLQGRDASTSWVPPGVPWHRFQGTPIRWWPSAFAVSVSPKLPAAIRQ